MGKKKGCYKLFGIIGCPVKHSLSPYMHNAAFAKLKIKAAYLPFSVKRNCLNSAMECLRESGISGFNVTIPFKSECIKYLDKVDPVAEMIGAVNTVISKRGGFIGYNTDYQGFIKSLKKDLRFNPNGKGVVLIGAGGAAKAVAFGLVTAGAREISVYDIAGHKATLLARNLKRHGKKCPVHVLAKKDIPRYVKDSTLLVNCTPLGMNASDPLPIDPKLLHEEIKVYDVVYLPCETRLVKAAKRKGIAAVGGLGMLLYQGVIAFELWTKHKAPVSLMKGVLTEHLK